MTKASASVPMIRLVLFGIFGALIAANSVLLIAQLVGFQPTGIDLLPLWTAARLAGENPDRVYDSVYVTELQNWWTHGRPSGLRPFVYPPSALLFFWPLGQLPFAVANTLWVVLTSLALLAATVFATPNRPVAHLVVMIVTIGFVVTALTGETTFLIGALVTVSLWRLDSNPWLAGVLLGIAATIKPSVLILAPFCLLAAKQYRALLGSIIAGTAIGGLSLLVFGPAMWLTWLDVVSKFGPETLARPGFAATMITPTAAAYRLGVQGMALSAIHLTVAAAAFVMALLTFRATSAWPARLVAMLGGGLLMQSYAMAYEGILLGPAVAAIVALTISGPKWFVGFGAFLLLAATGVNNLGAYSLGALFLLICIPVVVARANPA